LLFGRRNRQAIPGERASPGAGERSGQQAEPSRLGARLAARARAELGADGGHVVLDGLAREEQAVGDVAVTAS
jgi:hypothetical protein